MYVTLLGADGLILDGHNHRLDCCLGIRIFVDRVTIYLLFLDLSDPLVSTFRCLLHLLIRVRRHGSCYVL